jgi:hypothetical protein
MSDNDDLLAGDAPVEFRARDLPTHMPTVVHILPPDPTKMQAARLKQYTQQKIREAIQQLTAGNIDAVHFWLHEVAKDSPSRAIELFIELTKFSVPQLKEATMTVNRNDGKTVTFTSSADILAELNNHAE